MKNMTVKKKKKSSPRLLYTCHYSKYFTWIISLNPAKQLYRVGITNPII